MMMWTGRILFGFGVFLAICTAIIRRAFDSDEFLETFGVGKWILLVLFAISLALIGVGSLLLKKTGDMD